MFYIIEALFVGFYTNLLYFLFSFLNIDINIYILLFIIGFIKHLFGYFLWLHYYYCNYGEKCLNIRNDNNDKNDNKDFYISNKKPLIIDSIFEGLFFIYFGSILKLQIKSKYILFFILGFLIHILSELLGIHRYFCINKCIKK